MAATHDHRAARDRERRHRGRFLPASSRAVAGRAGRRAAGPFSLLCSILLCAAVGCGPPLLKLSAGRVAFEQPDDWRTFSRRTGEAGEFVCFQIPNPADVGTPDSANVSVSTLSQDGVTLEEFAGYRIAPVTNEPGGIVLETIDGPNPTTDRFVLMRAHQNETAYVIADRFAKRGTFFVHIRAAWPILEGTTEAWQTSFVRHVNQIFSGLLVDGKPIVAVGGITISKTRGA